MNGVHLFAILLLVVAVAYLPWGEWFGRDDR